MKGSTAKRTFAHNVTCMRVVYVDIVDVVMVTTVMVMIVIKYIHDQHTSQR